MTFLEFVCRELLGSPVSNRDGGTWPCPKCGRLKFHVKPHKPQFKDRAKCWVCDWSGRPVDEFDLLRHFHPDKDFGWRQNRIAELHREYARACNGDVSLSSPGSGESSLPGDWKLIDWLINGLPQHLAEYLEEKDRIMAIADEGDRFQAALVPAVRELLVRCPNLLAAADDVADTWKLNPEILLQCAAAHVEEPAV